MRNRSLSLTYCSLLQSFVVYSLNEIENTLPTWFCDCVTGDRRPAL